MASAGLAGLAVSAIASDDGSLPEGSKGISLFIVPKLLPDVVTEASATGGTAAGLAKYKELREKFYGAQAYDFSETGLLAVATRASVTNKADDALVYLRANLEYYPKSSRTYQAIAQIENTKDDKASAIKDLVKAVELDSNNVQARAQLQQLKGQ